MQVREEVRGTTLEARARASDKGQEVGLSVHYGGTPPSEKASLGITSR